MLLIADSGSTKTDWVLCDPLSGTRKTLHTAGFNPMIQQTSFIEGEIKAAEDLWRDGHFVKEIRYFGAGCSSLERQETIRDILLPFFPKAEIFVAHDMDAAVVAACGREAGFACILGTGSNAVLFDGEQIIEPKGYLGNGYILGDEGSGAYMGRMLLRDFLYCLVPEDLNNYLKDTYGLNREAILYNVYKQPNANSYMAKFAKDLGHFQSSDYVQQIVAIAFDDFFRYNIMAFDSFEKYPVNFVGSIAAHFPAELEAACHRAGARMGRIVSKPIDRIVDFFTHQAKSKA
jgi:glucosamine kinase